jgi:23S rRNA (uracil1939-C5)-methyltransferase
VVEASPDRAVPPCPYVGACGGCDLQHVAYPRQLALKLEVVRDAMRRQGLVLPAAVGVHGMDEPWRYRWRGEFHIVRDRAAEGTQSRPIIGLGFNRVRSWHPVAVDDCLIHHPTITTAMPALLEAARRGGDGRLDLLHLTAGEDGAELLVAPKPPQAMSAGALDAAALGVGAGMARWAVGATTLHWRGHHYRVSPRSFIQVNQRQMDVLYTRVLDGLGDISGARVVDAYAGIGVLSVELAARAGESGTVVCIEEVHAAARLGVLNAQLNGVAGRLRYDARRVEDALPEIAAAGPIDALVVDPPRAGCAGSVTGWLALSGPPRIVYVSCDPATLARDLHILAVSGPYAVQRLDVVDMFPQTHHVECVAVLVRG